MLAIHPSVLTSYFLAVKHVYTHHYKTRRDCVRLVDRLFKAGSQDAGYAHTSFVACIRLAFWVLQFGSYGYVTKLPLMQNPIRKVGINS